MNIFRQPALLALIFASITSAGPFVQKPVAAENMDEEMKEITTKAVLLQIPESWELRPETDDLVTVIAPPDDSVRLTISLLEPPADLTNRETNEFFENYIAMRREAEKQFSKSGEFVQTEIERGVLSKIFFVKSAFWTSFDPPYYFGITRIIIKKSNILTLYIETNYHNKHIVENLGPRILASAYIQ